MNDTAPSQASTKRNCCTPGSRVKTLVSRVVEKLRAEGTPLTIHNFKSKASYIANSFPSITNESRAILKGQALRMWLSDMNSSGNAERLRSPRLGGDKQYALVGRSEGT